MTKKSDEKIKELEKRIAELEQRPVYIPYPMQVQYPVETQTPWLPTLYGTGTVTQ